MRKQSSGDDVFLRVMQSFFLSDFACLYPKINQRMVFRPKDRLSVSELIDSTVTDMCGRDPLIISKVEHCKCGSHAFCFRVY